MRLRSRSIYKDGIIKYDFEDSYFYFYVRGVLIKRWYLSTVSALNHFVVHGDIIFSYCQSHGKGFNGITTSRVFIDDISSKTPTLYYKGKLKSYMVVVQDHLIYCVKDNYRIIMHCDHLIDDSKSYTFDFEYYDIIGENIRISKKIIGWNDKVYIFGNSIVYDLDLKSKKITVLFKLERSIYRIFHYSKHIFLLLYGGQVYQFIKDSYCLITTLPSNYWLGEINDIPYGVSVYGTNTIPLITLRTKDLDKYGSEMLPYLPSSDKKLLQTILLILKRIIYPDVVKMIFSCYLTNQTQLIDTVNCYSYFIHKY